MIRDIVVTLVVTPGAPVAVAFVGYYAIVGVRRAVRGWST